MNEYIKQYEKLADAIVKQAVVDYKKASQQVAECERFFRSGWFTQLSNLDGEALMDILDKTVK